MMNGTLFTLEGLLEVDEKTLKMTITLHDSGCVSESHEKGNIK